MAPERRRRIKRSFEQLVGKAGSDDQAFRAALDIAALSFPPGFNGVLPWGHLDNRPYLPCLHGCGLCLWCLGYFDEAGEMFERMLWLNPVDNQGARFLMAEVREKRPWRPDL